MSFALVPVATPLRRDYRMKTIRSNGRRPVDFNSFDGLKSTEPDGQRGVFNRQKVVNTG
jgi:hypothetical protein